MTAHQHTNAQIIDPCTREGFADIAATYGIESAFTAKINALAQRVENAKGMRWHCVNPERDLIHARFDFAWYLAKGEPARCRDIFADISL